MSFVLNNKIIQLILVYVCLMPLAMWSVDSNDN
jgi:hypothetical protein